MTKIKCPESIEELEELDKMIPLCRKELFSQAKARIESGTACSIREASRQIGDELGRDSESIRTSIRREQKDTSGYSVPRTEYQKEIIQD